MILIEAFSNLEHSQIDANSVLPTISYNDPQMLHRPLIDPIDPVPGEDSLPSYCREREPHQQQHSPAS